MATYTSNYGWTKPSGSDNVDISVLNDNLDDQDSVIHDAFLNMAPVFSEQATYAVGDKVLYETTTYKCHTAVTTAGSWTGSTNWQVYKLSEGGSGGGGTSNYNQLTNKPQINNVELSGNKTSSQLGLMASDGVVANPTGQTTGTLTALEVGGTKYAVPSGGTSDYTALTNKPSINGVTLSGNKTTSDLGIDKNAVGLGNVPNVSTNDQTPTFTEASTRNNIASGEKLSVILGKIQKFFNDLKTVAFSGSYTDLTNQPQINGNTLTGNKTTSDLGINADNVMLSDGVTSVDAMFFAPDYANAVAVTPNTTYSVLNDGYFIAVRLYGSAAGTWITINDLSVMQCNPGSARDMGSCVYPVKKGDTVITKNLDTSISRLYFAPYRR